MHRLALLVAKEKSKGVIPNTLGGQANRHDQMSQMKEEELESTIRWQEPSFEAQDPLIKVNLGTEEESRTIKVSGLLTKEDRNRLVDLVK